MSSDDPLILVYDDRKAGIITSALYLLTVPFLGSNFCPACGEPAGYVEPLYCASTLSRKPSRELQKLSKAFDGYPELASPSDSNAVPIDIVVMLNEPLCVVGFPAYIY